MVGLQKGIETDTGNYPPLHPLHLLLTLTPRHISSTILNEELHTDSFLLSFPSRPRPKVPHILIIDSSRFNADPLRRRLRLVPQSTATFRTEHEGDRFPAAAFRPITLDFVATSDDGETVCFDRNLMLFLVMLIVVVFFPRVGTFSPLNNVWLAIAQLLHADEISQWASWPDAASMTDKEFVKRMTELGLRGQYYKLTTAEAAGGGHAGWVKRKVA